MIHLRDITKTYSDAHGSIDALSNITLDMRRGQFLAVRGPSGCGKSTLLMVVGALCRPTSGSVRVADKDLLAMSVAQRARFRATTIGFVFQMFHLLPYLNILDNVTIAASPDHRAGARERATQLLERFELDHRTHHRPADLSAGERQRVAVARAMINQPDLLLADEPTGNLDPESSSNVMRLLADFHEQGGTVLLVTHDDDAAQYAQRSIQLKRGTIVTT